MTRYGQVARLKPEKIDEYKQLHAEVWPGVLKTISTCNIRNYTIFIKEDELFSYFEYIGCDFDSDMMKMAQDPITQDWWKQTKPCFLHHNNEIYYLDMAEIFHYSPQEKKEN